MKNLIQTSSEYALEINQTKMKVVVNIRQAGNLINIREVAAYEVVDKFVYLGSMISN